MSSNIQIEIGNYHKGKSGALKDSLRSRAVLGFAQVERYAERYPQGIRYPLGLRQEAKTLARIENIITYSLFALRYGSYFVIGSQAQTCVILF